MCNSTNEEKQKQEIREILLKVREQALCIKTNIQILKSLWELQPRFKEKQVKAFYQVAQDNCIFRIVLETYKLLYDKSSGNTILNISNKLHREMMEMETFKDLNEDLVRIKQVLKKNIKNEKVEIVITNNRKKVYAHNDGDHYWFDQSYIDLWGLTDQIYDDILKISEKCIEYCNDLLIMLKFKRDIVYHYSNYDDVKKLFGLKTSRELFKESCPWNQK